MMNSWRLLHQKLSGILDNDANKKGLIEKCVTFLFHIVLGDNDFRGYTRTDCETFNNLIPKVRSMDSAKLSKFFGSELCC